MIPYINFTRHLRDKYGGRLGTVTTIPLEDFRRECGQYLHITRSEGQFNQAVREMEVYGFIRRRQQSIDLMPSLF